MTDYGSLATAKEEINGLFGNRELFDTPKPTELLKHLLNISKEFNFEKLNNDDNVLVIKGYYESNKEIYINFDKLIPLLERYIAIDEILMTKEELKNIEDEY